MAGAAREHPAILVFGLIMSIALMGVAASWIAKLLHRYRWIGYVGLLIMLYVATERPGWLVVGGAMFLAGAYAAYLFIGHVAVRVDAWLLHRVWGLVAFLLVCGALERAPGLERTALCPRRS